MASSTTTKKPLKALSSKTVENLFEFENRKYVVLSETTGRSFGAYKTLREAKERLRQVEYFKHRKEK